MATTSDNQVINQELLQDAMKEIARTKETVPAEWYAMFKELTLVNDGVSQCDLYCSKNCLILTHTSNGGTISEIEESSAVYFASKWSKEFIAEILAVQNNTCIGICKSAIKDVR